jgi:hypothetical protein
MADDDKRADGEVMISTMKGLLPESKLVRKVVEQESANEIITMSEWYLDGELVRRDVWLNMKRGLDVSGEASALG